ncbi:hypothetical protein, partial [Erythrobacter sp.]|uniref:hypothetical protein n=1 Tax=Erythrobacter sp. TaxID=1042 RepID=UPI002EA226C0|nr:hypothetical protein [Erythrobacter sp.]
PARSEGMSHAPSPEARAIAAASIKSAPIGAAIIVLLFFGAPLLGEVSLDQLFASLWMIGLAWAIATFIGMIATGLCLLLFGSVIARVSRAFLATSGGLALAVSSSLGAVLLIGAIPGWASGDWQMVLLLCLPYALSAAILYRREILLESAFA